MNTGSAVRTGVVSQCEYALIERASCTFMHNCATDPLQKPLCDDMTTSLCKKHTHTHMGTHRTARCSRPSPDTSFESQGLAPARSSSAAQVRLSGQSILVQKDITELPSLR